ncbi:MAG: DUF2497 domain-containing protein [Afipia sp.]|nr:DUF2497 domain-containing protein [Afipia sp.]
MSNQGQAQEPTMEEILASIRRIISEDSGSDEPGDAPEPVAAEADAEEALPELSAEDEADILELTEPLPEEPLMAEPEPEPEPPYVPAPEEVEDDIAFAPEPEPSHAPVEEAVDDIAFAPEPEPAPAPVMTAAPAPEPVVQSTTDIDIEEPAMSAQSQIPIVSGDAERAASAAFGALASSLASGGDGRTLEEIVSDMLRPMLKEWLDGNLPPLVERLVAEEIERIARRRG